VLSQFAAGRETVAVQQVVNGLSDIFVFFAAYAFLFDSLTVQVFQIFFIEQLKGRLGNHQFRCLHPKFPLIKGITISD